MDVDLSVEVVGNFWRTIWSACCVGARLAVPQGLAIFEDTGFETIDREVQACAIDATDIAETYRRFDTTDLACTRLIVAHRRRMPASPGNRTGRVGVRRDRGNVQ